MIDDSVVTKIYEIKDMRVQDGEFSMGSSDNLVTLKGKASATLGSAWGAGELILHEDDGGLHRVDLYLFHVRDESWMDRMMDLIHRAPTI